MGGCTRPYLESAKYQGIRGIASLFIVTSHCIRAFLPHYLSPADEYNGTPHLFQLPYFRVVASGPFWTSIFFILSGYVCAVKPLRLSTAGEGEEARKVIASSAFRRVWRIGVPTTLGTIFPWVLCQLGLFQFVARRANYWSGWLHHTIPERLPGIIPPLRNLVKQCFNTWAINENEYEQNQWTLSREMRGSFLVFLALSITATHTVSVRRSVLILTALYFFNSGEFLSSFCFFSGALLADLSLVMRSYSSKTYTFRQNQYPQSRWRTIIANHWPIAMAMFALFLGTMPPEEQELVAYSRVVYFFFSDYITAEGGMALHILTLIIGEVDRTIGAFAGIFLIFSILFSPHLQRFLSNRYFLFLGSISFPLYLLHGTFIRIPLLWAVLSLLPRIAPDALDYWDDGDSVELRCDQYTCRLMASIIFLAWLAGLLAFSKFWKDHVDVLGIQFSRWAEEYAIGKGEIYFDLRILPRFYPRSLLSYDRRNASRKMDTQRIH